MPRRSAYDDSAFFVSPEEEEAARRAATAQQSGQMNGSAIGSLLGGAAGVGASFIPGLQPLAPLLIPGGIGVGGAIGGALGSTLGGMQAGDRVVAVDGAALDSWDAWVEIVRAHPGRTLAVEVERGGAIHALALTPLATTVDGARIGRIGAEVAVPEGSTAMPLGVERYAPLEAVGGALERTAEMSVTTLKFLYKMVVGEASVQNLSGPISIAHYAGASARLGLARFLEFLALVSVSLAVLNLLPIPPLDGSHVMKYLLPAQWAMRYQLLGRYGVVILLVLLWTDIGKPLFSAWMKPVTVLGESTMQAVFPYFLKSPYALGIG